MCLYITYEFNYFWYTLHLPSTHPSPPIPLFSLPSLPSFPLSLLLLSIHAVTCLEPTIPNQRRPRDKWTSGSLGPKHFPWNTSIHFSCRHGFFLLGSQEATCTINGTWTALPSCKGTTHTHTHTHTHTPTITPSLHTHTHTHTHTHPILSHHHSTHTHTACPTIPHCADVHCTSLDHAHCLRCVSYHHSGLPLRVSKDWKRCQG